MKPLIALLALAVSLSGCALPEYEDDDDFEEEDLDAWKRDPRNQAIEHLFQADAELLFAAFRSQGGGWVPASSLADRSLRGVVRGPYTALLVCATPSGPTTVLVSGTLVPRFPPSEHPALVDIDCLPPEPTAALPQRVRGVAVQPGEVILDDQRASSTSGNWAFELGASAGPHDLFVLGADRVQVLYGLATQPEVVLPPIDMATQGSPLTTQPVRFAGALPDEVLSVATRLFTAWSYAEIYRGPAPARVPPVTMGVGRSISAIAVRQTSELTTTRVTTLARATDTSTYLFWTPFDRLQWEKVEGQLGLSWAAKDLAGLQGLEASVEDDQGRRVRHLVRASERMAAQLTEMALTVDAPGYRPEWRVDPSQPHTRRLSLSRTTSVPEGSQTFALEQRIGGLRPTNAR